MKNLATLIILVVLTAFSGPKKDNISENARAIPSRSFEVIHNLNIPMVSVDKGLALLHTKLDHPMIDLLMHNGHPQYQDMSGMLCLKEIKSNDYLIIE